MEFETADLLPHPETTHPRISRILWDLWKGKKHWFTETFKPSSYCYASAVLQGTNIKRLGLIKRFKVQTLFVFSTCLIIFFPLLFSLKWMEVCHSWALPNFASNRSQFHTESSAEFNGNREGSSQGKWKTIDLYLHWPRATSISWKNVKSCKLSKCVIIYILVLERGAHANIP